jgi:hypothetical protein
MRLIHIGKWLINNDGRTQSIYLTSGTGARIGALTGASTGNLVGAWVETGD